MWKLFRKLGFRFMDELSFEPSPVARCAAGLSRRRPGGTFKGCVKHTSVDDGVPRRGRHLMESPVLPRGPQGGAFLLRDRRLALRKRWCAFTDAAFAGDTRHITHVSDAGL